MEPLLQGAAARPAAARAWARGPHAVRHGELLLQGEDGALYTHRIKERGVPSIERAGEKMLVEGRGAVKTPSDAASPCGRRDDRARVKLKQ